MSHGLLLGAAVREQAGVCCAALQWNAPVSDQLVANALQGIADHLWATLTLHRAEPCTISQVSCSLPRARAAGSVPGSAAPQDPNRPGYVMFQSYFHLQRPALLLAKGQVWCARWTSQGLRPHIRVRVRFCENGLVTPWRLLTSLCWDDDATQSLLQKRYISQPLRLRACSSPSTAHHLRNMAATVRPEQMVPIAHADCRCSEGVLACGQFPAVTGSQLTHSVASTHLSVQQASPQRRRSGTQSSKFAALRAGLHLAAMVTRARTTAGSSRTCTLRRP